MVIEDGKFYFIKDDFFDLFKDYKLMENKEGGTRRPCYFCFRDRKDKEIIWFVPISTKYDKYKKIYEEKKIKNGNRLVYNFVFGNVLGKDSVFLIQNMFPTTEQYIMQKYIKQNRDVIVNEKFNKEIQMKSNKVLNLVEKGYNKIFFPDIISIKNQLLKNKNSD